jgi:hypothetical protein
MCIGGVRHCSAHPVVNRQQSFFCPVLAASIATSRSPVNPVNNATVKGWNVVG